MGNEDSLELPVPPAWLKLDDLPFTFNDDEWIFFRKVIGGGDDELKARFEEVRKM